MYRIAPLPLLAKIQICNMLFHVEELALVLTIGAKVSSCRSLSLMVGKLKMHP